MVRISPLLYIFHLGGVVRQTMIEGLARMSEYKRHLVRSNQFYFALSQVNNKKPEWLDDIKRANFELYLNRKIEWFEHKLCRPDLNTKLPGDMRLGEVKKWLNFESEIQSIKESLWEENVDNIVRSVCLALTEIKG